MREAMIVTFKRPGQEVTHACAMNREVANSEDEYYEQLDAEKDTAFDVVRNMYPDSQIYRRGSLERATRNICRRHRS